jgi:cardiolipin synthase
MEVRLETYIFDFHAESLSVAQALESAAWRGVCVYLIVDGVGTPSVPVEWLERWKSAGVHLAVFDPVGPGAIWYPSRWRRLHRKLCVIDQEIGFCGGINILDDHYNPQTRECLTEARLDFAVQISGPCVNPLLKEMQSTWQRLEWAQKLKGTKIIESIKRLKNKNELMLNLQKIREAFRPQPFSRRRQSALCKLVVRDNLLHRNSIANSYLKAFERAGKEIFIASAFFLPQDRMLKSLIQAAKRGVCVTLLLQGRYEFVLPYRAARQIYGKLLEAGVQIVEYQLTYLHAKVACVDSAWSTVGSSNLDPLSLLLAREANLVIKDKTFNAKLKEQLKTAILNGGVRVDPEVYRCRGFGDRILDRVSFWLMKLAILVSGQHYTCEPL